MKNMLKSIWYFFSAISKASYAAELSRNGKWQQAQAMYRD